jgi:D-alanyl-D-alanine carboxypeptidase
MPRACRLVAIAFVAVAVCAAPAAAGRHQRVERLQRALDHLVKIKGGPPGASALLVRGNGERFLHAGVADVDTGKPFRRQKQMRIASVSKAFSGAVALSLVDDGVLSLDDSVTSWVPALPPSWSAVTLRQVLNHTSGLPNYTANQQFQHYFGEHLHGDIELLGLIDFVRDEPLEFSPGSDYEYSNTDNIVVSLVAEAATGKPYTRLLRSEVYRPLGLRHTDLPRGFHLPGPLIHGYDTLPQIEDLSECCSMAFVAASGGIYSTPHDLGRFTRGYVGGELFGGAARSAQFEFIEGAGSEPPGPGKQSGGLALFRYETGCGTVYGHTGNFPGYTQFTAATANGRRSVTVSVNRQIAPDATAIKAAQAFKTLHRDYRLAVCALLG